MRALLIVVVGIAAIAAPLPAGAQAGSGWILWEKNMIAKSGGETVTWAPQDGFESLRECRESAQTLLGFALAYMKSGAGKLLGDVRPDGRSAMFELAKQGPRETIDIRYLCFPGGFDPRPRAVTARAAKP
jgi:hypothetical protein